MEISRNFRQNSVEMQDKNGSNLKTKTSCMIQD